MLTHPLDSANDPRLCPGSQYSPKAAQQPNTRYSHLVEEVAAAINLNGISYAVMMITPDHFEDFVIGFLFAEGIISQDQEVHEIDITPVQDGVMLDVTLANRCFIALKQRKRRLVGATGCGICGVEALGHALPDLPPLPACAPLVLEQVDSLKQQIHTHQLKAQRSGAIHAAFALDEVGNILECREDIGRHNALDKLIGALLRQKRSAKALLMTSRCSSELIQKAVRYGANHLISLASPSQLAVKLALKYQLNLVHIPKFDPPIHYSIFDESLAFQCNRGEFYACSY